MPRGASVASGSCLTKMFRRMSNRRRPAGSASSRDAGRRGALRRSPPRLWGARFYAAYRAWRAHGDAVFHDLLSPRLHEAWTSGAEERSMCSRMSISISPWPWRRREGRTPGAWGGQRWGHAPGEAWPPSPLPAFAARRRAYSQRRAVARRAIWLSALTFARPAHGARRADGGALCRPKGAGNSRRAGRDSPPFVKLPR